MQKGRPKYCFIYAAVVQDMKEGVEELTETFSKCATNYLLSNYTLKKLHDFGEEFIGHSRLNKVINY